MSDGGVIVADELPQEPVRFDRRDRAALIAGILLAALWFEVFGLRQLMCVPGIGVFIFAVCSIGSAALYLGRGIKLDRTSVFLTSATLLLALSCGIWDGAAVRWINVAALSFLIPASCFSLAGRGFDWRRPRAVFEEAGLFFGGLFRYIARPFRAVKRRRRSGGRGAAVAGTMVLAMPLFALVIWLLSSADAVFSGLLGGIGGFFTNLRRDVGNAVWRTVRTLAMGLMFFSLLYSLAEPAKERAESDAPELPGLPFVTIMAALDVIYAVFAVIQAVFLFGGAETAAMHGGYAQYARSGFFQLVAVAGINLAVMLAAASVKKRGGEGAVKALGLIMAALTLVILVSAAFRMALYIGAYGMSCLRALTLWGMAYIAFATAMAVWKTLRPEGRVWGKIFSGALILWCALSMLGLEARVADYNVNAYLSGKAESVDLYYLGGLSRDVVPSLRRLEIAEPDYKNGCTVGEAIGRAGNGENVPWACATASRIVNREEKMAGMAEHDELHIAVELTTDEPIYRISCDYYLDGELRCGECLENADGSPLAGEDVMFPFRPGDFPDDAADRRLTMRFYVATETSDAGIDELAMHAGETPVDGEVELELRFGATYRVVITGDSRHGYSVERAGNS